MTASVVPDRLLLVCIFAGLALSAFAALEASIPPLQGACTVNAVISCQAVNESVYSRIGPIPIWALGLGGFILLLALAILFLRTRQGRWLSAIWIVAGFGLIVSVALVIVEVALIHAVCPVCLASYVADLAVFMVAWRMRRKGIAGSAGEAADEGPGA